MTSRAEAESPADRLVARIAASLPRISTRDVPALPEASAVDSFQAHVQAKAWWCYSEVAPHLGKPLLGKPGFLAGYRRAWSTFYLEAAKTLAGASRLGRVAANLPQVLFISHYPEYPRLVRLARERDVPVLIKRRPLWMRECRLFLVDELMSLASLLGHLRAGGAIFAMIDHAYATTRNRPIEFLGRPCETPMGLFELASRMSLSVGLLLPRRGNAWSIARFDQATYTNAAALATAVLRRLSAYITADPRRWLLWPNLNLRWSDAASAAPSRNGAKGSVKDFLKYAHEMARG